MLIGLFRATVAAVLLAVALAAIASPAAASSRARSSVIGGHAADLSQWGFTAAVFSPSSLCTGSVLSPTQVLTAAHCVGDPALLTVRTKSTSAWFGGETRRVTSAAIAPGWSHGLQSDLAVLTLSEPTSAPPIELPSPEQDRAYTRPGAVLSVAGFGARNPSLRGKPKIGLLTATQVFAHGFCPLPAWAICDAGGRSGLVAFRRIEHKRKRRAILRTVCSGDSGGPLVASTPEGPRLVGVTEASATPPRRSAFGFVRCGLKGYPALHTRTASYLDFLEANLGP